VKFAFFSAQYLPTIGGIERYTRNLALALTRQGHHVTIIASEVPGAPQRETDEGVEVMRLPSWPIMAGRFPVPRPTREFRAMMADLWKQDIDLALINTRFWPMSVWAARACSRRKLPAIVVEHGSGYLSMGSPVLNVASHVYEHVVARLVRHYVPRFYAVSQNGARWLTTFGIQAAGVLYNAVDIAEIETKAALGQWDARSEYGLDTGAHLIVYVGRLIPEKGIREMLAAMKTVRERCPDAVLLLAGEGPMYQELENLEQDGVIFIGALDHPRAMSLLHQADVFCMPSYSEGFSTVVLEAVALKTFMVTTPVGGTTELLDADYGGLVDSPNPDVVAAALIRALTDPAWRSAAIQQAWDRLQSTFTWEKTAQELVDTTTRLQT